MKRYLILMLTMLVLASGLLAGCGQKTLSKEAVLQFGQAIWEVEKEREKLIVEYQTFTKKFLHMPTLEVFDKAEYFVKTHTKLRQRMLNIATPHVELKRVHSKFSIAYGVENKAYLAIQSFLITGDEGKLYDGIKLFSKADSLFLEAYDEMSKLLQGFGLKWSDIQK